MRKAWPKTRLGEVLIPVVREESVDAAKDYRLLGIRLAGQGPFLRETVSGAGTAARTLSRVAVGDFIYSRLFACRGAFGLITADLDGCYVSGEFPTFVPVADRVCVEFLRYWFRLPNVIAMVDEDCSGSTPLSRNRFKEHFFLDLEVPLPPLPEQQRIVGRVEELSAKIEAARRLRGEAIEDAKALVISLHVHLSAERTRRLGDLIRLDEDVEPVSVDGSYRQVGVKSFGGGLFPKGAVAGSATTYRGFNRLYDGALVLSQVKGWEGAVAVCPAGLAGWFVSPEYRTFRCVPSEARSDYLAPLVLTEWFWGRLANATRGVGARRERTRPEQFLNIELPMPDVDKQEAGERLLAEIGSLRAAQVETAMELDALLPSILDRAFKGTL